MARGDHIWVTRPLGYTHHGIDCGDGTVIHFTGEPGKKSDASVARTLMSEFALDSIVHLREYSEKDDPQVVIDRAESKLSSKEYNLVTNNCEHFATWCCTGRTASQQVRMVSSLTTTGAAAATSLGTTAGVVGAVGSVAGVSGAGVMAGLATAGGVIGVARRLDRWLLRSRQRLSQSVRFRWPCGVISRYRKKKTTPAEMVASLLQPVRLLQGPGEWRP